MGKSIPIKCCKDKVPAELNTAFKRDRPNRNTRKINILLENTPAHKSKLVQDYLEKQNIETLPHPPYFPDLAPCYFFLFHPNEEMSSIQLFSNDQQ